MPKLLKLVLNSIGFILVGFLLIPSAYGQEFDKALFYQKLCPEGPAVSLQRRARIDQQKQRIEQSIQKQLFEMSQKYDLGFLNSNEISSHLLIQRIMSHFGRDGEMLKKLVSATFRMIEKEILKTKKLPSLSASKRELILILDQRNDIAISTKLRMIKNIQETELMLTSEYIENWTSTREEIFETPNDPWIDGAWNIPFVSDLAQNKKNPPTRIIILSPGVIASAAAPGHSLSDLDFALAHELSHGIDDDSFPEVYRNGIKEVHKILGTGNEMWTEITADFWGAQIIAHRLMNRKLNPNENIEFLMKNYEILCGLENEDQSFPFLNRFMHPSGQFRIENILGGNFKIQKIVP